MKAEKQAGKLLFSNLNAKIANLGNAYADSVTTTIDISSTFMDNSSLNVNWSFNVSASLVGDMIVIGGETRRVKTIT